VYITSGSIQAAWVYRLKILIKSHERDAKKVRKNNWDLNP